MNPIIPDWSRVNRATNSRLGRTVPADASPVQNANEALNKTALTLNRAGTGLSNPVLLGLGTEVQFKLKVGDTVTGVWCYRTPGDMGPNLKANVSQVAPGTFSFFLRVGSELLAGGHDEPAVRNFIRIQSRRGGFEKEMWCKDYSAAIIQLDGQNALAEVTFEPAVFEVSMVAVGLPWIDIPIDFFCDWADEFQVLHKRTDGDQETGFLKAYGGSKYVSFFDTSTADEGVGVQVNPVNQAAIEQKHKIQVQNTEGLKEITVRFRSKVDSDWFVDVPIEVNVTAPDAETCTVPVVEPCTDLYLKHGTALPEGLPSEPSVPDVQVVAGEEGEELAQDLLVVTVRGAISGATPKLRVRKWAYVTSGTALAGVRTVQVGDDEEYLPLVATASSPDPGDPYGDPKRLTIAFGVNALRNENVAHINVEVLDGDHISNPILVFGPRARDIMFTPAGGTGGGPVCGPY